MPSLSTPSRVRVVPLVLALSLFLPLLSVSPSIRAEDVPVAESAVPRAVPSPAAVMFPTKVEPTLLQEIHLLLEAQDLELGRLRQAFAEAENEEVALRLQRRIDRLRRETEVEVLRAQLRHLKRQGLSDAVADLEATLTLLLEEGDLKVQEASDDEALPQGEGGGR